MNERKIRLIVFMIICISAVIRSFFAATLDLGNDEVYYITYALYPDWSHFDHPPMVGWIIQLFTANLYLESVFFIRFGSIVLVAVSSWIIYLTARLYGNPRSGLMAVVLYTASIYVSIITGVFILPDTPQVFFWLLALYYYSLAFKNDEINRHSKDRFLIASLFVALSMLSKYTSVFLWVGVVLFIIRYKREWLSKAIFYVSLLLSLLLQLPVLIWNMQNHFISFTYQGARVSGLSNLRPEYFLTEIVGEFFYNNPVNVIICFSALALVFIMKRVKVDKNLFLVIFVSIPLILTFWLLSLFHSTLPHWTGPAFTTMLLFAAVVFEKLSSGRVKPVLVPKWFQLSLAIALFFVSLGYLQITSGVITGMVVPEKNKTEFVNWDISLDMYGWKQLRDAMPGIYQDDLTLGKINRDPFFVSWRWFPAANLDYYVALPMGLKLYTFGKLEQVHKYYWINKLRGSLPYGKDAYFICTNRDKKNPGSLFRDNFKEYSQPDTLPVFRGGRRVMEFYIYRLHQYQVANPAVRSSFVGRPTR